VNKKRMRRHIPWVAAVVVLVLAGLSFNAYYFGTRAFLEYAEAFSFRRMVSTQQAEQDTFRFFYATNRQPSAEDGEIEKRFKSERGKSISFGSFDTKIQTTLGLGMIIDPSEWFLNEEIQLSNVRSLEREAVTVQLREQVEASPDRSLLLVVHGFRERFPSALRKTAFLAHVLDIDTPVLVFDWPGDQGSSLRGYRRARRIAEASGEELAQTLKYIIDDVQPNRLWLMANSMGGQVVIDAFNILYQDIQFSDPQFEIEDVVLTAPDVDHEEFNDQFIMEIKALAQNVSVYVSSNDRALLVSRIVNRGLRLGESTLDPNNPGQVEQAKRLTELLEPDSDQLALIDVTPVNRTRNFHNFSLETPEFFDDLFLRLTGSGLPQSRGLYPLRTPRGARYYVLTRAR